jgi:hypothetical protein
MIEYPPPDPDGRPHIWTFFDFQMNESEVDLGEWGSSMGSIEKQHLEPSEGLEVIVFDDDGGLWGAHRRGRGSLQCATR